MNRFFIITFLIVTFNKGFSQKYNFTQQDLFWIITNLKEKPTKVTLSRKEIYTFDSTKIYISYNNNKIQKIENLSFGFKYNVGFKYLKNSVILNDSQIYTLIREVDTNYIYQNNLNNIKQKHTYSSIKNTIYMTNYVNENKVKLLPIFKSEEDFSDITLKYLFFNFDSINYIYRNTNLDEEYNLIFLKYEIKNKNKNIVNIRILDENNKFKYYKLIYRKNKLKKIKVNDRLYKIKLKIIKGKYTYILNENQEDSTSCITLEFI